MKKRIRTKELTYNAVHLWLKYYFGNGLKCERCGNLGHKTGRRWSLEYSLKPGLEHAKVRERYDILCKSCHRKQDCDEKMKENMSKGWILRKERGHDLKRDNGGRFLSSKYGYKDSN